jgi:hypothetical protein
MYSARLRLSNATSLIAADPGIMHSYALLWHGMIVVLFFSMEFRARARWYLHHIVGDQLPSGVARAHYHLPLLFLSVMLVDAAGV